MSRIADAMKNVDYSYINYPDRSYGRVTGRRKQAWELASRITGKPIKEVHHLEYGNAFFLIIMEESKRQLEKTTRITDEKERE